MRELVRISAEGQRRVLTSALVGSTFRRVLSAGDIVGPGMASGESSDPDDRRWLIRNCRYHKKQQLTAVLIAPEHMGKPMKEIFGHYENASGDLLMPGPARWAMNPLTAKKGLIHFGKSPVDNFMEVVLVQIGIGPKSKAIRPVGYIDETISLGEYPSYTTDAALTIHDWVGSADAMPANVYTDRGELDNRQLRVMGASWLITYCDRIYDRLDNQERLLTRLFITPEADKDEVARALKKVFGLGDLRSLSRYLRCGEKRVRPSKGE